MKHRSLLIALCLTLLLLLVPVRSIRREVSLPPEQSTLRCVLPEADADFQHLLLRKYAQDQRMEVELSLGPADLDSLRSGAVDLVILPDGDSLSLPGIAFSRPFADGTVWAVRSDETEALRRINLWITELSASPRFNRLALTGQTNAISAISAYDALLREAADDIGWDWRLLSAVVYHESRFHNEASSAKGAIGLMQIRSPRYTPEELLDPQINLSVGSRYLRKLEGMFPAAGPMDSVKFALAAFNLGEGKVGRLIEMAQEEGLDATRWDNVALMLPEGHHTVSYVNNVLDTYAGYVRLYPR